MLCKKCELAALCCFSANGARHLANTPPNEMTPAALAAFAQGIAEEGGCECVILGERQMETLGLNALLAVGQGSRAPGWAGEVLASRDRSVAAPTFAPDGLYFLGPRYDAELNLPTHTPAMDWLP